MLKERSQRESKRVNQRSSKRIEEGIGRSPKLFEKEVAKVIQKC